MKVFYILIYVNHLRTNMHYVITATYLFIYISIIHLVYFFSWL
jgi:hypothetical protein